MNLLDVAIIALCLGFALYGIVQGVVRQLFSWGGLILGVVESLTTTYLTAGLSLALTFFLLLIMLILRPRGIFGKGMVE